MSYSVSVSRENGWVEVHHHGPVTPAEMYEARHQTAQVLQKESLARILVDVADADVSRLSLAERFQFSASHQSEFVSVPHVRIAVIVAANGQSDASFSETVARNRGTTYRVFADRDEACAWL